MKADDVMALEFSEDIDAFGKYQTIDGEWHKNKMADYIDTDFEEKLLKAINHANDMALLKEMIEKGEVAEACLICNPKYGREIKSLLYQRGIRIPILLTDCAEEDKILMVVDKELCKNIRELLKWELNDG